jgi:hypothetical protein
MFFDCPLVTDFWNHLAKLLHELLGHHPLQKKLILYGYSTLGTTPQHLVVLAVARFHDKSADGNSAQTEAHCHKCARGKSAHTCEQSDAGRQMAC